MDPYRVNLLRRKRQALNRDACGGIQPLARFLHHLAKSLYSDSGPTTLNP